MRLSKLKKLRVLSGMTQGQLAERIGCSQSYLSLLEREQREISDELKLKIKEIFNE